MTDYQTTPNSSPGNNNLSSKLLNPAHWLRLLLMLLMYTILFTVVQLMVSITLVVQWILVLFKGAPNLRLKSFTAGLNRYAWEILEYLNFNSERCPFPLSDWPEPDR